MLCLPKEPPTHDPQSTVLVAEPLSRRLTDHADDDSEEEQNRQSLHDDGCAIQHRCAHCPGVRHRRARNAPQRRYHHGRAGEEHDEERDGEHQPPRRQPSRKPIAFRGSESRELFLGEPEPRKPDSPHSSSDSPPRDPSVRRLDVSRVLVDARPSLILRVRPHTGAMGRGSGHATDRGRSHRQCSCCATPFALVRRIAVGPEICWGAPLPWLVGPGSAPETNQAFASMFRGPGGLDVMSGDVVQAGDGCGLADC